KSELGLPPGSRQEGVDSAGQNETRQRPDMPPPGPGGDSSADQSDGRKSELGLPPGSRQEGVDSAGQNETRQRPDMPPPVGGDHEVTDNTGVHNLEDHSEQLADENPFDRDDSSVDSKKEDTGAASGEDQANVNEVHSTEAIESQHAPNGLNFAQTVAQQVERGLADVKNLAAEMGHFDSKGKASIKPLGGGRLWANKENNDHLKVKAQLDRVKSMEKTTSRGVEKISKQDIARVYDYYAAVALADPNNPSAQHRRDLMKWYLDHW
ncbi:hypothetical protein, partial [Streptomyces sp. NPDC046985]|uniref:hypothetical protein n=1 Tax=Streptomyces sp. NPDC046985 TaxID=3155377 RepID=UPI0033E89749